MRSAAGLRVTGYRRMGASKKITGMESSICHHGRPLTKLASLEFSSYLESNLTTRELPFPNNYVTYVTLGKVLWTSAPFNFSESCELPEYCKFHLFPQLQ